MPFDDLESLEDSDDVAEAAKLVKEINQARLYARFDEPWDLPLWLEELSYCYERLGRTADALVAARQAVAMGGKWEPDGRCRQAEILLTAGRLEESAEIWSAVKADTPDDVWLYNNAGIAYQDTGDHETALAWLTEGLDLAIRTGDPEQLVTQLIDLRQASLAALGRPADEWDELSERFLAEESGSERRKLTSTRPLHATPLPGSEPAQLPEPQEGAGGQARQAIESRFRDGPPDVFDADHFVGRAGAHFTGRSRQLRMLGPWLDGMAEGQLRVVAGSPGAGKSALLGALVHAAHPALADAAAHARTRLDQDGCPSVNETLAVAHARQRRLDELMASLGRQLRLDEPDEGWAPEAFVELLGARPANPVIVVDAVDEAMDPVTVMDGLLLPLTAARRTDGEPACRLLVGMRPCPELAPLRDLAVAVDGLVDLDAVSSDELCADLRRYLAAQLAELPGYRSPAQRLVRERLAATVAAHLTTPKGGSERPQWGAFLVAEIFTRFLDTISPAQNLTAAEELAARVPRSLPAVLELDLSLRRDGAVLRAALAALAYAKGEGMPAELIRLVASGFTGRGDDDRDININAVLDAGRCYLRTAIESDGTVLYRLSHQSLADYLLHYSLHAPEADITRESGLSVPSHPALVFDRLLTTTAGEGANRWRTAAPYLLRHAIQHAVEADSVDRLLVDHEFLVHADPTTLIPELHRAQTTPGRRAAAVYRASVNMHRLNNPDERRRLLSIDATRYGSTELAYRLMADRVAGDWWPRWATGSLVHPALRDTLTGHTGGVERVACTMIEGRPVAVTAGEDQTIRVWNLVTGEPFGTPITYSASLSAMACAQVDGRPIVLGCCAGDEEVWMHDLITGEPFGTPLVIPTGTTAFAIACMMNGDRPVVVAGGFDATVYRWDLITGKAIDELHGQDETIYALSCLTDDGNQIVVSGDKDGQAYLWDLNRASERSLTGHTDSINAIACATVNGRQVAVTTSADRTIRLWNLTGPRRRPTVLAGDDDTPAGPPVACTTVDGRAIAVTGEYQTVRMWDLTTCQPIGTPLTAHTGQVTDIACTTIDGRPVAVTTGMDHTVRVWELTLDPPADTRLPGHTELIAAVDCITIDDRPVVVTAGGDDGGDDHGVRRWDLRTGEPIGSPLNSHTGFICDLACATVDGRQVAVTAPGYANDAWVWDLTSGHRFGSPLTGHTDGITAVACTSMDGRPVAVVGSHDGTARIWDLATGRPIGAPLIGHNRMVLTVACIDVNDRPTAVTCGYKEHTARVWDLATGQPASDPLKHLVPVTAAACTTIDGRPVALIGAGDVLIWDLTTGLIVGALMPETPYQYRAIACATVNDRPAAITASADAVVRVWDLATQECLDAIPMPAEVFALSGTPDGALVVCSDRDLVVLDQIRNERP